MLVLDPLAQCVRNVFSVTNRTEVDYVCIFIQIFLLKENHQMGSKSFRIVLEKIYLHMVIIRMSHMESFSCILRLASTMELTSSFGHKTLRMQTCLGILIESSLTWGYHDDFQLK